MEKEILTVKEWAERARVAGLEVKNFDGFLDIYEHLLKTNYPTIQVPDSARFRESGDLMCSRNAFESHLYGCTIRLHLSKLSTLLQVLPNFVEREANNILRFSTNNINKMNTDTEKLKELAKILEYLSYKLEARAKLISEDPLKFTPVANMENQELKSKIVKLFHGRVQKVENAELLLSEEIAKEIEKIYKSKRILISNSLIEKIELLTALYKETFREKASYENSNEFMLIKLPGEKREDSDFIMPFNVIDANGIQPFVMFNINDGNSHIEGNMPITKEIKERLEDSKGKQL